MTSRAPPRLLDREQQPRDGVIVSDAPTPDRRRSRILRLPEVASRLGVSHDTVRRMVRDGRFPPPLEIARRSIGWLEADLDVWLAERRRIANTHASGRELRVEIHSLDNPVPDAAASK